MYNVGDYIVYKRDVCVVKEINKKYYKDMDYYKLEPINDNSLKLDVPVNNKYIRNIISREELDNIIDNIPNIDVIKCSDKYIENDYKSLMHSGRHEDLIKIIKTTYLRNKERIDNKKKVTDKDIMYFKKTEEYLYTEVSIVFGVSYEEAKKYVVDKVEKKV